MDDLIKVQNKLREARNALSAAEETKSAAQKVIFDVERQMAGEQKLSLVTQRFNELQGALKEQSDAQAVVARATRRLAEADLDVVNRQRLYNKELELSRTIAAGAAA